MHQCLPLQVKGYSWTLNPFGPLFFLTICRVPWCIHGSDTGMNIEHICNLEAGCVFISSVELRVTKSSRFGCSEQAQLKNNVCWFLSVLLLLDLFDDLQKRIFQKDFGGNVSQHKVIFVWHALKFADCLRGTLLHFICQKELGYRFWLQIQVSMMSLLVNHDINLLMLKSMVKPFFVFLASCCWEVGCRDFFCNSKGQKPWEAGN